MMKLLKFWKLFSLILFFALICDKVVHPAFCLYIEEERSQNNKEIDNIQMDVFDFLDERTSFQEDLYLEIINHERNCKKQITESIMSIIINFSIFLAGCSNNEKFFKPYEVFKTKKMQIIFSAVFVVNILTVITKLILYIVDSITIYVNTKETLYTNRTYTTNFSSTYLLKLRKEIKTLNSSLVPTDINEDIALSLGTRAKNLNAFLVRFISIQEPQKFDIYKFDFIKWIVGYRIAKSTINNQHFLINNMSKFNRNKKDNLSLIVRKNEKILNCLLENYNFDTKKAFFYLAAPQSLILLTLQIILAICFFHYENKSKQSEKELHTPDSNLAYIFVCCILSAIPVLVNYISYCNFRRRINESKARNFDRLFQGFLKEEESF